MLVDNVFQLILNFWLKNMQVNQNINQIMKLNDEFDDIQLI